MTEEEFNKKCDELQHIPRYANMGRCELMHIYKMGLIDNRKYMNGELRICNNIFYSKYNRDLDTEILDELELSGINNISGFTYYCDVQIHPDQGQVTEYFLLIYASKTQLFWDSISKTIFFTILNNYNIHTNDGIMLQMIGYRQYEGVQKHVFIYMNNDRYVEFVLIDPNNPSDFTVITADIMLEYGFSHNVNCVGDDNFELILCNNSHVLTYSLNKTKLIEFDRERVINESNPIIPSYHYCFKP